MKTIKLSIYFAAVIIGTSFFTNKVAATIPIVPMDISERAVVKFVAVTNQSGSVSIVDAKGITLNTYGLKPGASSSTLFDFSEVENGTYTFNVKSEVMNTTSKIKVEDSYVEVLSSDIEYKPFFILDGKELRVNYLNTDLEDMQLSLESYDDMVYYAEEEGNSLRLQKRFDISKLFSGEKYLAKLVVGYKTYYYTFYMS